MYNAIQYKNNSLNEYYNGHMFQGMVAIVTGGASGLGLGTVQRFVKQGAKVVIADLPSSRGKEVADELGNSAVFAPTDVSVNKVITVVLLITEVYELYTHI